MSIVRYWIKIADDFVSPILKNLEYNRYPCLNEAGELNSVCSRLIELLHKGYRYLIITVEDGENSAVLKHLGIWQCPPDHPKYSKSREYLNVNCLPSIQLIRNVNYEIYRSLFPILERCYFQSINENHGKDQNQLQGEEILDSRCGEGSILHYRRDGLKYSAGRTCNQARAKIYEVTAGGYQVKLSTRSPEILGYESKDRLNGERSSRDRETPGGVGIQCDCLKGLSITLKSGKKECTKPGDAFVINGFVNVLIDPLSRKFVVISEPYDVTEDTIAKLNSLYKECIK